jgi:hypothetical protein
MEESEGYMKFIRLIGQQSDPMIILSVALLLLQVPAAAQSHVATERGYMYIEGGGVAGESSGVQIARAMAAGPRTVSPGARIVGVNAQGKSIVLREGNNGFTCQPGNPTVVGRPASCANEAALQWSADLSAGRPGPTNKEAGFVYMLSGATERSNTGAITNTGPQWMIIWPFDPQASGLSATKKNTGAYIRWAGTPYAHLNIMGQPFGEPAQHLASEYMGLMPAMGVHDGSATGVPTTESAEVQIARAISAGPKHVTDGARLLGTDAQGKTIVLREGDNGFVCRAGSLTAVAQEPQCSSTKSKPTITYMLAGATQRSVTDPNDNASPSLAIAPHWMIMMRFDPKTSGIPEAYTDTGAYLMWASSPIGHMHINGAP